ncbi:MAG: riboflavin synthase [Gammaproteobacteria bacterium]
MFGGLITALGIAEVADGGGLSVCCPGGFLDDVANGASIAVDGVCLTATKIKGDSFRADLSAETIRRCAPWQSGQKVHLEKPLRMGDEIGGHFVSGHIDGIAIVISQKTENTGAATFHIAAPKTAAPMIAEKGSVALAGVSLTIGEVFDNKGGEVLDGKDGKCIFAVHIIPHTLQATTLGKWQTGQKVNIEADILARYCARLCQK